MGSGNKLFGAYDIRGTYGQALNEDFAFKLGRAFGRFLSPVERLRVLVGHDSRTHSPCLTEALIAGLTTAGHDVVTLSVASTPMIAWFGATNGYDASIAVTASHLGKEHNGFKLYTGKANPIGAGNGLKEIEKILNELEPVNGKKPGSVSQIDGVQQYIEYLTSMLAPHRESTVVQPKSGESPASPSPSAAPLKGNYPAVDSLEWRVLKKTFKGEPISQRLSRLETKLLGQASPGMALFDRVERLKKIAASVAAGSQPANPGTAVVPPGMLGPMPKAYPRGNPFSFADPSDPLMPGPFSMQPLPLQPFAGTEDLSSINRLMSEMFSQMNRQMRDLKSMPPGVYQYKIEPGAPGSMGITPFKIQPGKPGQGGQLNPFQPLAPKMPAVQDSLPPYADPNSI